jgi:hypothetical protein
MQQSVALNRERRSNDITVHQSRLESVHLSEPELDEPRVQFRGQVKPPN